MKRISDGFLLLCSGQIGEEMSLSRYGLSPNDQVKRLGLVSFGPEEEEEEDTISVGQLAERLRGLYCGTSSLQCDHVEVRYGRDCHHVYKKGREYTTFWMP